MCRIFGLLDPALTVGEARAAGEQQLRDLWHGGPDSGHLHVAPGLLLGATRLAINDVEHGDQPFRSGRQTVFYNGEIYNGMALRTTMPGATWRTRCDGEILPRLLSRHGTDARARLDGMYAVAAWDEEDRSLLLIRDPAGVKPLYFFRDGRRFGFASEIPALVALRGQGARPDLAGLEAYLRFRGGYGRPADAGLPTAVVGVMSLEPGAALRVRADGRTTYSPPLPPAPAALDGADSPTRLAEVLQEAVVATTMSDVPYCAVLSGGLDSSAVTAMAARSASGPLHTFTVVPAGSSRFDESAFAREVASRYRTVHHEVVVEPAELPSRLPAVVRRLGMPNADPITVSTHVLFEAISAAGFKVALTGDGSDEIFAGYGRFRAASRGAPVTAYADDVAGVPAKLRAELLSPEFAAHAAESVIESAEFRRRYRDQPLRAVMEFEQRHRLPVYHLQRLDHLSAAHAVEARVPFCQTAVRDVARSLSPEALIAPDGRVKKALTEAARPWVPASVITRPKQPFTFSLSENLFGDDGSFLEWAREVLLDQVAVGRGLFRHGAVEKLCLRAAEQRSEPMAQALWSLLVLELWLVEISGW